jgi:hypothetical protein
LRFFLEIGRQLLAQYLHILQPVMTRSSRTLIRENRLLRPVPTQTGPSRVIPGFDPEMETLSGSFDQTEGRKTPLLLQFVVRVANGHQKSVRESLAFGFRTYFDRILDDATLDTISSESMCLDWACAAMTSQMRVLSCMWIDSGKRIEASGVDAPELRNVEDTVQGYSSSLYLLLWHLYLKNYRRHTGMRRDGKLASEDLCPRADSWNEAIGIKSAIEQYGNTMAAFFFCRLLDSPFSRRLARCDQCHAFFAYRKTRLREVTHGVFCDRKRCRYENSRKRMQRSRSARIDTAAEEWLKWSRIHRGEPEREWLVRRVNSKHNTHFGRRWVTQNLDEISAKVQMLITSV